MEYIGIILYSMLVNAGPASCTAIVYVLNDGGVSDAARWNPAKDAGGAETLVIGQNSISMWSDARDMAYYIIPFGVLTVHPRYRAYHRRTHILHYTVRVRWKK